MTFHFPGFTGFFGDHFYRSLKIKLTFNLFLLKKILSTHYLDHYLDFTFPRSSDTPSAVVGSPVGKKKNKNNPPQNKLLMPKLQIHSTATVKKQKTHSKTAMRGFK